TFFGVEAIAYLHARDRGNVLPRALGTRDMITLDCWPEKYALERRPRRLLTFDGGGILGVMSLEILKEFERQLAEATGEGDRFRFGRHFDYIAGTSTGAIIAAGLAVGMSV